MKAAIATNGTSTQLSPPPHLSDDDVHTSDDSATAMTEYSIDADDDTTREVIWVAVDKCMRMHPAFSSKWHAVIDLLMDGEGPLPTGLRYYVATMAASRHHNGYVLQSLMSRLSRIARNRNKDMDAFLSIQTSNSRHEHLQSLNRLLAHQPWLISASDIQPLCGATAVSSAQWSVPQLLHAGVIMTHIHALCSFVSGCGICLDDALQRTPPIDAKPSAVSPLKSRTSLASLSSATLAPTTNGHTTTNVATTEHEQSRRHDTEVRVLMQRMAELRRQQENGILSSEEQCAYNFTSILGEERTPPPPASPGVYVHDALDEKIKHMILDTGTETTGAATSPWTQLIHRNDTFTYTDFAARADKELAPTLKSHDYSWESQGYGLLSQSHQALADALDDKFRLIQELTYNTMGDECGVDTLHFRRAIWTYIQSLYGIRHDDYDYAIINHLISRPLKTFIKTVACYPERVTAELRDSVMTDFHYSEKVHVILLTKEARLQAELLYFLRATMRYMSQK